MPTPPRLPISDVEHVRPAAPMSWMPTSAPVRHHLETRFEQKLLGERIANLHRRPLFLRLLVELGRGHRRAVNAVAAGLGADVVNGIARAARCALDDVLVPGDAEAEHVDERVAAVRLVECDLAADGRDADAVAVAADAGDDALENAPVLSADRAVRSAAN